MKIFLYVAAISAAMVSTAMAENTKSYYFGMHGFAGPSPFKRDFKGNFGSTQFTGHAEYSKAFAVGITGGVFLNKNWRVGIELDFMRQYANESFNTNNSNSDAFGMVNTKGAFVDVGYEFEINEKVGGFVEGGVGVLHVDPVGGISAYGGLQGKADVLAGKVGAGLTYKINESFELYSKYNYVVGEDVKLTFEPNFGTIPVQFEVKDHLLLFGLRYKM